MQVQEERDINGLRVETRQLAPMRAYRLMAKLGRLLPTIARAMTPESLASIKAGNLSAALPIALAVFGALDEMDAGALALDALRGTCVYMTDKGVVRRVDLTSEELVNAAFEGNLKAMLGAMLFSLEVNFRDFFPASAPSASATPTASPSSSQPT